MVYIIKIKNSPNDGLEGGVLNLINTPYSNKWQTKYMKISGTPTQSDEEILRFYECYSNYLEIVKVGY